ncbi:MAG TPA: ABC transporter permease [Candidatus Angelobacter sp.]|nr:ABC transporter permease [Candidatus Angelobacter sp.]
MSLLRFFRRRQWDEERARELAAYLEIETAENVSRGMSAEEARTAAHCKLGNPTLLREEIYRMNSLGFIETLWQDIRYGARMLRKAPGFTAVAVLTLALGIGANTAIFSMVDWLMFQQLPVQDPKALTYLGFVRGGPLHTDVQFSFPEYQQITAECGAQFDGMAAMAFGGTSGGQSGPDGLTFQGKTHPVQTYFVTGNFFSVLGLKPAMGRFFAPQEGDSAGADPITVLSWEYWLSRFQGDPDIIGKSVAINGHVVTIVGVGPKGFFGPTPLLHIQAYLPLGMLVIDAGTRRDFLGRSDARSLHIFARLKHGTTADQIRPALDVVSQHLLARYPRPDEKLNGMRAVPLRPPGMVSSESGNPLARTAAIFIILGVLVLMLACVNVANLLLVRATARRAEMAVRAALGAARGRLIRQLLTESLMLAFLGCVAGIATGLVATRALGAIHLPTILPVSFDFRFNWLVFAGALSATLLSSLLAGIAPALQAARPNLNAVLHDAGRSLTSRRQRLRSLMVTAQVAGSLSLLIVAGLFTRSLQSARQADVGFDPSHVSNLTMDPHQVGYTDAKGQAFYRELLERARALPGVESASLAAWIPMGDTEFGGPIDVNGIEPIKGQPHPSAHYNAVSPGYFHTMGIPIEQGRDLLESDSTSSPHVALINRAMAEKYWPGQDALGRQFSVPDEHNRPIQIVGVVRNFRMVDPYSPIEPAYFVPLTQHYFATVTLHIRSAGSDSGVIRQVLTLVDSVEPTMPVYTSSMTEALSGINGYFLFRLGAILTGILGGLGLVLAIVGVYGVMSYSVSQRTHEIGIRMALGAQRGQILTLVGRQGLWLVTAGLAIGVLVAFAVGQLIRDFLVGIGPADAPTYLVVSALLAAVAAAACMVPARSALRVDPILALRNE